MPVCAEVFHVADADNGVAAQSPRPPEVSADNASIVPSATVTVAVTVCDAASFVEASGSTTSQPVTPAAVRSQSGSRTSRSRDAQSPPYAPANDE